MVIGSWYTVVTFALLLRYLQSIEKDHVLSFHVLLR